MANAMYKKDYQHMTLDVDFQSMPVTIFNSCKPRIRSKRRLSVLPLQEGMTFNWLLFVWGQLSPKPKWRPAARDLMTMEMYDRKVPVAGWFA